MTLRVRNSGAWQVVNPGSLRIKEAPDNPLLREFTPDMWVSPSKVWVKLNGQWNDTGYTPAAGQPGSPTLESSSYTSLTVAWTAPVTGVTPTSYNVALFNQAGTKAAGITVQASQPLKATFSNDLTPALITNNTNYSVVVTGIAAGSSSTSSQALKIRTGQPSVTHTETVYDWATTEGNMRPGYLASPSPMTSMYAPGYSAAAAVDPGDPADGWAAPYVNAWVSAGRAAQISTSGDLWEGMELTLPNQKRKITRVQLVTEPTHTLVLGVKYNGTWIGTGTPAALGMATTGYPTDDYTRILVHNYLIGNNDHSTNVRVFDVESQNLEFSGVDALTIAVGNFINLYGTAGTTGTAGSAGSQGYYTWVYAPLGATMVALGSKTVALSLGGNTLSYAEVGVNPPAGVSSSAIITRSPTPPASTAWNNNDVWSWRVSVQPGNILVFAYTAGHAAGTHLQYNSGATIYYSMSAVFGGLGQYYTAGTPGTAGTAGTAAIPAWRARVSDVLVYYKDWVPSGTRTVTDQVKVDTVNGPSSW